MWQKLSGAQDLLLRFSTEAEFLLNKYRLHLFLNLLGSQDWPWDLVWANMTWVGALTVFGTLPKRLTRESPQQLSATLISGGKGNFLDMAPQRD